SLLLTGNNTVLAVAPGTLISNTANASFAVAGSTENRASNTVDITTRLLLTPAKAVFFQYAPSGNGARSTAVSPTGCSLGSATGPFPPLPDPSYPGIGILDASAPIELVHAERFHQGEPVFIEITDKNRNLDRTRRDTVEVTLDVAASGDQERLQLSETAINSGVFVGYIQSRSMSATQFDCLLAVDENDSISVTYVDLYDSTDRARDDALVDPFGIVFDSATGNAVDGARVTIVDVVSGLPADVFGDDGISTFPSTVISGGTATDSSGKRYSFPPGGYRFPFMAMGKYRLEVLMPAYEAPSDAAIEALQQLPQAPFALDPAASYGKQFMLMAGPPLNIDMPLDPAESELFLQKSASHNLAARGDFVRYTLDLVNNSNQGSAAEVIITDVLPLGLRYQQDSVHQDNAAAPGPVISDDGRTLRFKVGTLGPGESVQFTYVAEVTVGTPLGEAVNVATARAQRGTTSNAARAIILVEDDLLTSRSFILGRVMLGNCEVDLPDAASGAGLPGVPGVRLIMEDGRYVITDEKGMYHFEGLAAGTHVVQVDPLSIPEQLEIFACEKNSRFAGSADSQFADIGGGLIWRSDFYLREKTPAHGNNSQQTDSVPEAGTDIALKEAPIMVPAADDNSGQFNRAWLDQATPGLEWLSPGSDFNPAIPSIKIAIKHDAGDRLTLRLNGQPVNNINADGSLRSSDRRLSISRWSGIDLQAGGNHIEVIARNAAGETTAMLERNIHFSGMPVYAEFVEDTSHLIADGRTIPVVAVRLTDKWGKPVREGVVGNFRLDPPYIAKQRIDALRERPLSGQVLGRTRYTVGKQGIALIEIEPTTITGKLTLFFDFAQDTKYAANVLNRDTREISAWLKPAARDWILVGLAEAIAADNDVSGNMETLDAAGGEDNYYQDGRLAFYAKGRVKGDMLLTIAYDTKNQSDSERGEQSLFQTINPDRYYTLYGDATEQRFDAPSSGKLYLRIERDQFYALFGDFNTGLTVTELSRYSRSMTGIKTEYDGKRYGVNAFAAESDQVFVRDQIQGNGTSGLYTLSENNIIINSDKITLETRDRFRPGIVIESRELSRFLDYNINILDGTLFFKQPVPSRDEFFNPVYIVAVYETASAGDKHLSGGGRARVKLLDDRLEVGVSAIHQGDTETGGNLFGTDLRYDIDRNTELRVELASSDTTTTGNDDESGNAYLAQLTHNDPRLSSRLYIRKEDEAFGLGQQSGSNSGTRRLGADLQYLLTENLVANGEVYRDEVFVNDNARNSAAANIEYFRSNYRLSSGLIHTRDDLGTGETNISTLLTAGASRSLLQDSLILRARAEVPVGGKNESIDYPGNITLGADYLLSERISLFAEQEFAYGDTLDSSNTRIGLRSNPWALATINTSLETQVTENGPRLFSNLGLTQGYAVNPHLQLDFGIDSTRVLKDSGATAFNPAIPPSTGTLDGSFTAVYAGSSYARDLWSATSR
ncbi:MAG: hypothetical protein WBP44_11895, partial [Gammaproteobacteria bacterium]